MKINKIVNNKVTIDFTFEEIRTLIYVLEENHSTIECAQRLYHIIEIIENDKEV